jgi:hypothetical protein
VPADSTYDLAFETIGNATLIAHDRSPILATDPWLFGPAYFGSWILSHEIPEEQLASVHACRYVWISHGHPDHLSMPSLETLRDKTILLPDHVGGRIRMALEDDGFRVKVLPDRQWVPLSPRIRVLSIADVYQDAVLLVEMDGLLVINANDCNDHGWGPTVRRAARRNRSAFLLALSGFGDADMINYFDLEGNRIPPRGARRIPPGLGINRKMARLGATRFIPFASMHRYQREDSVWANEYTTKLDEFAIGFDSTKGELLPAFVRYDCAKDSLSRIDPPERVIEVQPPSAFGDDWSEPLTAEDRELLTGYVEGVASLSDVVDSVTFRVGGADHEIALGGSTGRSVRFEAPRGSLVSAARWEIFDDLLIGNYVKTTLLGDWPSRSLRPDFTSRIAKYADNGRAHTSEEIRAYMSAYRRRAPLDYIQYETRRRYVHAVRTAARTARRRVGEGSTLHRAGSAVYGRALR